MASKSFYPPLKLIHDMELEYPNGFTIYEKALQNKRDDEVPLEIASDVSRYFFPTANKRDKAEACTVLLTVVGEWRKSKQVYSFSKELVNLISDVEEFTISDDIFDYLPYPCFYVEVTDIDDIHGVFVKRLKDAANNHMIFLILCKDGTFCYNIFDIEGSSTFYVTSRKYADEFEETEYRDRLRKSLIFVFQAAMYLCAKNCDVVENPVQKGIYRPSTSIKNKFSEIRKWDVGYRVAKDVQRSNASRTCPSGTQQFEHNRPREHWRKAHWHTYWVGPKGQQQKELRFIAPIHVNKNIDELPVVNHKTGK